MSLPFILFSSPLFLFVPCDSFFICHFVSATSKFTELKHTQRYNTHFKQKGCHYLALLSIGHLLLSSSSSSLSPFSSSYLLLPLIFSPFVKIISLSSFFSSTRPQVTPPDSFLSETLLKSISFLFYFCISFQMSHTPLFTNTHKRYFILLPTHKCFINPLLLLKN